MKNNATSELKSFQATDNTSWRCQYKKAVTFSYDDGNEQDLKLLAILNKYGMKATFNLNTGLEDEASVWNYKGKLPVRRLVLSEHMEDYAGHEIAVHGHEHLAMTECSEEELDVEIRRNYEKLTALFGKNPVGMAYPYGVYSDRVVEKLQSFGIRYARGVESTYSFCEQTDLMRFQPTCHHDDARVFEVIDQFLKCEADEPQILYIWGHSYEFEGNDNWDRMEEICKRLANHPDIFYGTNAEVLL